MLQPTSERSSSGSTPYLFGDQLLVHFQYGSPLTAIGVNFELRGTATVPWICWALLQDCVMGAINRVDSHVEFVILHQVTSINIAIFSEDKTSKVHRMYA